MTYFENFRRVSELCRICTIYSEKVSHFHDEIASSESSSTVTVLEALEKVLSVKINDDPNYPKIICKSCLDRLRLCYDFKDIFRKSQCILEKYIFFNTSDWDNSESSEVIRLEIQESLNGKVSSDGINSSNEEEITDGGNSTKSSLRKLNNVNSTIRSRKKTNLTEVCVEVDEYKVRRSKHRCTKCSKRCLNSEMLQKHMKICTDTGTFECDICTLRFDNKKQKNIHMRYYHNKREYKCDRCDAVFPSTGTVWYHKNRVHVNKTFPCKVCGKIFNMKNSYNKHLNTHNKDISKVICQICGKGFHYESGLFYHMRVHKNIRNYVCTFCPKRFLTMSGLKRHMRTHTGERPYFCSFCAKSFSSLAEVKTHERRHTGQKPHICIYCKKCYISTYNLQMHMSTHPGMYPCDHCHKSYLNAHVLKLHMKYKHNIKDDFKLEDKEEVKLTTCP